MPARWSTACASPQASASAAESPQATRRTEPRGSGSRASCAAARSERTSATTSASRASACSIKTRPSAPFAPVTTSFGMLDEAPATDDRPDLLDRVAARRVETLVQVDGRVAVTRQDAQPLAGRELDTLVAEHVTVLLREPDDSRADVERHGHAKVARQRLHARVRDDQAPAPVDHRGVQGQRGLEVGAYVAVAPVHEYVAAGLDLGDSWHAARQVVRAGAAGRDDLGREPGRAQRLHVRAEGLRRSLGELLSLRRV